MASYNRVLLMGRLTRNPELRRTPSGAAVVELGLAVSDNYKSKTGELVERTCFVDVVVWNRQAETVSEYLHKGSPVFVEGRLQLDQWETPQGEKRSKLRVRADRIQFLGGGSGSRGEESAPAPTAQPAPAQPQQAPAVPPPEMEEDDDVPF